MIRPPGAVKHPKTKEIKAGSAVALSLDQFQSMNLTLRLAITVLEGDRRANRIIVPIESHSKPFELRQPTHSCFVNPSR